MTMVYGVGLSPKPRHEFNTSRNISVYILHDIADESSGARMTQSCTKMFGVIEKFPSMCQTRDVARFCKQLFPPNINTRLSPAAVVLQKHGWNCL